MEFEDLLDEEVRKELIALDEELCSLEEDPYSSHTPLSKCYSPKDTVC